MQYDFDAVVDRSQNYAAKVEEAILHYGTNDVIPLWIADMDFKTAPCIVDAIKVRADQGIFGYTWRTPKYFEAIAAWQQKRNGWLPDTEHMAFAPGVVPGMRMMLTMFTQPGDKILIQQPVYHPFADVVNNTGRQLVVSPLKRDENGRYTMDLEDFAEKAADGVKYFILCNPHNPVGRVWTHEELKAVGDICVKHGVRIISDEIHSDLMLDGHKHIPMASVSSEIAAITTTCIAPSKTFNLAGLVGSYSIIYNSWLRDRVAKEATLCHYNAQNVLSMYALIGAYRDEGIAWLEELRQVLNGNVNFACDYIRGHFPGVTVSRPQGTYMLFLDCTEWCRAHEKSLDDVLKAAWAVGVAFQDGRPFHGPCHIRVNLALPLSRVQEAFRRLDQYVFNAKGEC